MAVISFMIQAPAKKIEGSNAAAAKHMGDGEDKMYLTS